jgi:hypothetical protein
MERARGGHWLPQEWQARRANLQRGRASLGQQIGLASEKWRALSVREEVPDARPEEALHP